ncbi:chlorophyll a-b binding protein, chloroplastic-like [Juglans regia]|uniref:Chlorophyll a-b binding protein, chloroplastic n=1 Tax=Juglans regia TaxID=51240 RepID=A0A6P9EGV2_JUGRE|nr:chlorophyll a-b binding protein, chloroplastic-like [Juglans regia]
MGSIALVQHAHLLTFILTTTLFIIELILISWAEGRDWADSIKTGYANTKIFTDNKFTGIDVGYPGGLRFDPLGWGTGTSPEKIKVLRTKEIKNRWLAMLDVNLVTPLFLLLSPTQVRKIAVYDCKRETDNYE